MPKFEPDRGLTTLTGSSHAALLAEASGDIVVSIKAGSNCMFIECEIVGVTVGDGSTLIALGSPGRSLSILPV